VRLFGRGERASTLDLLVVGLGNPGREYERTRHNAGWLVVDELARRHGGSWRSKFSGSLAEVRLGEKRLALLKPETYMNESGRSVSAAARFFKVPAESILVAHDELDLMPGQVKMKLGGGHAGHNGLKDIHAQLGSADYWRLRLGIGHPGVKAEVINYVLRKPPLEHREGIEKAIEQSLDALDLILAGDMERAMMKVHAKPPRPKPPKPAPATDTEESS